MEVFGLRRGVRKLGARLLRRARRLARWPSGPVILMYHRIAQPSCDPWDLAVTPANFEAQMSWLGRRRTVLPLLEFEALHRKGRLPNDAAAITFDDGYACNALIAAPILAAYRLPATIFLTTGAVAATTEFWWDDLERIVTGAGAGRLGVSIGDEDYAFELNEPVAGRPFSPDRAEAYTALWRAMRPLDAPVRRSLLRDMARHCGLETQGRAEYRTMTEAEISRAAKSPWISFGAHSVTHPALSGLTADEQRAEIETSRTACASLTGVTPAAFAYPYGDYDDTTVELVREAGFTVAVTTDRGMVSERAQSLRLPRVQINDWPERKFAQAISA